MMDDAHRRRRSKLHIILVHGACHGAWCWYKVATLLKSAGHRVTVPDLAASGIDTRKLEDLANFADYSQPLLEIMASLPPQEKAILVGHSLGGMSIALAAEKFPEKVSAVVFLTAFMPDCKSRPSRVMEEHAQFLRQSTPPFPWLDTQLGPVKAPAGTERPFTSMFFGPQFIASKLYQLCSQEDLMLATTLVRPASLFVEDLESMPAFSEDRYGSVPRFYILCCQDAVIVKDYQQRMIQNHPVRKVIEIERADHMAMLSTPQELHQSLLRIADDLDA